MTSLQRLTEERESGLEEAGGGIHLKKGNGRWNIGRWRKKGEICKWGKNEEMRRNGGEYSKPHHCHHPSQFLLPPPALNVAPLPVFLQLLCRHLFSPPPPTLYPFLTSSASHPPFPSPSVSPPHRPRLQPSARVPPMLSLIRWRRDKAAISPCQGFDMTL